MNEKLLKLLSLPHHGLYITINDHKSVYQNVGLYLANTYCQSIDEFEAIDKEVFDKMIEYKTIVCIRIYPDTPVSFIDELHYDLEKCIDEILKHFEKA